MNRPHEHDMDALDRYLDDLLDAPQRAAIESKLARDPELRAEVEAARRIDESLRLQFDPQSSEQCQANPHRNGEAAITGSLRAASNVDVAEGGESIGARSAELSGPAPRSTRRTALVRGGLLLAACILLGLGLWQFWVVASSPGADPYEPQPWRSMAVVYNAAVEERFTPTWICRDDEEFADAFNSQYGQPLVPHDLPEGVEALGMRYSHTHSVNTTSILFRVHDTPVMVFVDRLERENPEAAAAEATSPEGIGGKLFTHRRTLGMLVLYEVSPLPEPVVLDHLRTP